MPSKLRTASEFAERDVGELLWDSVFNSDFLSVSDEGFCVEWVPRALTSQDPYPPARVPVRSHAHLHSGIFTWDFLVEEMNAAQIGVGFMLQWDQGLDWGFFGYLGAGPTAWSYDPSTGDVVTATESIAGGLPSFADKQRGTVSVRLKLPRDKAGSGVFAVNGVQSPPIVLPIGAVVVPAACLLREGQRVRLGALNRTSVPKPSRSWRQRLFGA